MIGVEINQKQIDQLVRDLKKVGKIIASPNLQLHRAKTYRNMAVNWVKIDFLGLMRHSGATEILTGKHSPEFLTGALIDHMKVKPHGKTEADVGYFKEDNDRPKNTRITYTQIAILQHTGYRIPLTGRKGARVRAWLAAQGVFTKDYDNYTGGVRARNQKGDDAWIVVPPRPFMLIALDRYIDEGIDIQAADQFIDRLFKSPDMPK
jgi:hypothetical protein